MRRKLSNEPTEALGLLLPASQKRRLFDMAWERRISASELVRQALDAYTAKAA